MQGEIGRKSFDMSELQKLVDGFRRFHDHYFATEGQKLYEELVLGQRPSTLVIACSDSRVDPAIVMDCKPGDLFVVRNVANLVPPYEKGGGYHGVSAALEFAVCALAVENIIVLGHRQCGGIKALFEGIPDGMEGEFIKPWVNMAKRAAERVREDQPDASDEEKLCHCEMAGILVSLENLRTFPFIQKKMTQNQLRLHGWYFDIVSGEMQAYNDDKLKFEPLIG
jgi:carbonic anhydrase